MKFWANGLVLTQTRSTNSAKTRLSSHGVCSYMAGRSAIRLAAQGAQERTCAEVRVVPGHEIAARRPNRARGYQRRELLSLNQLCQRNCCGLRVEPCEITTLTRAGPRKFIASSRAPGRSFGSSTKKPLPPKASITLS